MTYPFRPPTKPEPSGLATKGCAWLFILGVLVIFWVLVAKIVLWGLS